jgi:hypothetical protein
MQLRLVFALLGFVRCSERLSQHIQPFLSLSLLSVRLGEQGKPTRPVHLCPRGPHGDHALAHLGNALLSLPLLS